MDKPPKKFEEFTEEDNFDFLIMNIILEKQEKYSKEDIANFQIRYPTVLDDLKFIKGQIWSITNYSLLIYGATVWAFDIFSKFKGFMPLVSFICLIFDILVGYLGLYLNRKFKKDLDSCRDRSIEIERIIKVKYLEGEGPHIKRDYLIENVLLIVTLFGFLVSIAYIYFKSIDMIYIQ